jgi:flavin reductase (DIM6/NTAB) family NADH-FMN oxidoreductase RutF
MSSCLAALFKRLTQGVYVVGVAHGEERNAFTAAWIMQVSFDPLVLALSINPHHSSYRLLKEGGAFSVNVLKKGQLHLAEHFGRPAATNWLLQTGRRTASAFHYYVRHWPGSNARSYPNIPLATTCWS